MLAGYGTQSEAMMIGLVGCGLWGQRILRDLHALGQAVLVVDPDPARRSAAHAAGAAVQETLPRTSACRAWIVATPAQQHAAVLDDLAGFGQPILCEKPLAADAATARAVCERLSAAGVRVHMMDVWRYHPAVEWMRDEVREGRLGAVNGLSSIRANWTSPRQDVDTLENLGPHEISLYREVFEREPSRVEARGEFLDGRLVSVWMRLDAGPGTPWLQSTLSNRSPIRQRRLQLHATDAVAVHEEADPALIRVARGAADAQLEAREQLAQPLPAGRALHRQLQAWLGFLDGGLAPKTDIHAGLRTLELLLQAREKAGSEVA